MELSRGGDARHEEQLNASCDEGVEGSFHYLPAQGEVLDESGRHLLRVTFTPADSRNYLSASAAGTVRHLLRSR